MFRNVSAQEYAEEYRVFQRIFSSIRIPSIYDVHDLCHEAIQIYYARSCKAVRYLCCIDAMRKKHSRQYKHNTLYLRSSFSEEDMAISDDYADFQHKIDISSIWTKIERKLNKQEKTIFLKLAEGYSQEDIAAKMKISASRVCQVRRTLFAKIRKLLGPELCAS